MSETKLQTSKTPFSFPKLRTETIGGYLVAVFALFMAITEMANNKLKEDLMISQSMFVDHTAWYQAKSVKQSIKESELSLLNILNDASIVTNSSFSPFREKIDHTKTLVHKYAAEKTEILVGSSNIPQAYWAQDLDGQMGVITGVKEWEKLIREYGSASQVFNLGILFFQVCLVMGILSIIVNKNQAKIFTTLTLFLGILGITATSYGFWVFP
ncbi:protein of unknown function [Arenibacter nanhaiticus]|uniref:Four helix bundle sensory module for signal transduction n=1 Tax=Arenibacter nanhaiticus TaxID=558155 RepID=A0A1M6EG70_9FLAO|nr:DUF4337 family protein [Arenibacter nanhaiticus]SHI84441.1 protein of unknown function [Arenibacter nanhaiticus]